MRYKDILILHLPPIPSYLLKLCFQKYSYFKPLNFFFLQLLLMQILFHYSSFSTINPVDYIYLIIMFFPCFSVDFFDLFRYNRDKQSGGRGKHTKSNYCIGYPGFLLFFNTECCRTKLLCFLLLLSLSFQCFTA